MNLFRTDLAIEALRPGDDGYAAAARVFFASGAPALVIRPRDPDEVASALDHAARHGRAVSVRSGGHSLLGHGTNTGGLVIDLGHLDRVDVIDPERRLVRVGGGATWGQVSEVLDPYRWAITAGDTAGVGVGGLTLGGGIGWLVRRDGLAIDNLVSARVVTADGQLVTASKDEHPELFWALRGGGGNFGVAVDFDFAAQPVACVHFGTVDYAADNPSDLLRRWREAMRRMPDEVTSTLVFSPRTPAAQASATVLFCHASVDGEAKADVDAVIHPLVMLGTVTAARIETRRYAKILEHVGPRAGVQMVVRNTLVREIDDNTIAAVAGLLTAPNGFRVAVRSLGGAFGRVPADATAFAHRDAEAMIIGMLMVPDAGDDRAARRALEPWHSVAARGSGIYLNFQSSDTAEDLAAAYPAGTSGRLAAVKRRYDPGNVFSHNHNIAPAAA